MLNYRWGPTDPFLGTIDEVRISKTARSTEWLQTEYNNQKAPAAFYTVGVEETTGTGADPFNNGWTYRKRITIDASKVPSNLTNFPVLINTTDPDLTAAQANFNDILFTAADGATKLDHEIEDYDSGSGKLVAWVEVRSLSGTTNTELYLYYGNANAVDQRNPTGAGVWEPNYVGVWHLKETSGDHSGSTWNYHTGSPQGGLNQDTTGPIDGADYFNGSDAYITIPSSSSLNLGNSFTIECWAKRGSINTTHAMLSKLYNPQYSWKLSFDTTNNWIRLDVYETGSGTYQNIQTTDMTVTDTTNWHHVVARSDSGSLTVHLDGTKSTSTGSFSGNVRHDSEPLYIGAAQWSGRTDEYDGALDEIRISKITRSEDWIVAEYNNQSNPAGFYTIGLEEQDDTESDPLQNGWTYRKRLTIDASRVAGDLTNFPVLISTIDADWIEDGQVPAGHVAQTGP